MSLQLQKAYAQVLLSGQKLDDEQIETLFEAVQENKSVTDLEFFPLVEELFVDGAIKGEYKEPFTQYANHRAGRA